MNRKVKVCLLFLCDIVAFYIAALFSFYITTGTFSFLLPDPNVPAFAIGLIAMVIFFVVFHLYGSTWRYAGVMECLRIAAAVTCCAVVSFAACLWFGVSLRYALCQILFFGAAVLLVRFSRRFVRALRNHKYHRVNRGKRVIVIGAGDAGQMILREMFSSHYLTCVPVCLLDDDPKKIGLTVEGVPVFGKITDLPAAVARFGAEEIFVAIPSAPRRRLKEILEVCQASGLHTRTLPGVYQLVNEEVSIGALRDVEIGDLLGREQIRVNLDEIMGYIENQVVLVTGGGGSIGSELCRQIAHHHPRLLIILDIYENNAYEIEQELRRTLPDLPLLALIASVRDKGKMEDVFRTYRPQVVFNAAAHKHVPLMETSPNEAIKNNVFGTLNVARMADCYGVRRFVQISTDKAVNPTNIMGASKRLCEMIIQAFSRRSKTEFVAVRFGNVLGSNGSVIPLFKRQIAEGGPVTVTHKDIIRYFMTIPEAVSLVLQAGAYAKGGEIFVLDMGEPVRIYDLATNLIRLSGLEPGVDIEIRCTGLRPGEKLYEERLMAEEGLRTTPNGMISIAKPIEFDDDAFFAALDELYAAAYAETRDMKERVAHLVPTYHPDAGQS